MSEQGSFLWYELSTSDVEGARRFYGDVVGWETERFPGPEPAYWVWTAGGQGLGGVTALTAESQQVNPAPHWLGYVHVADVDGLAKKAAALGGATRLAPHDIPTVGRSSVLADPQGAVFALIRPTPREGAAPPQPAGPVAGRIVWHELLTSDPAAALRFYGELLGWKESQSLPMPEIGAYHIYGNGSRDLGGIFTPPTGYPLPPHFLYYVHVADLDAAIERVQRGGGRIWMGPAPIPSGERIAQCADPQGAVFALHGK